MAETTYKKGEVLFGSVITTKAMPNNSGANNTAQISLELNQDVLITVIDDIEYVCEANRTEFGSVYGGFGPTGPDFSIYPFAYFTFYNSGYESDFLSLYTENPGTYSFHIYTAIPDSDSDSSSESIAIRNYIDKNLTNLNWNILPQIFEAEGVELTEKIKRYLKETPKNTNWNMMQTIINSTDEGLVIIDGTPVATYQSGGDYTSIGFLFESEPTTLANIEVGTTFTVEINNQSYDFTIAVVNTESGNRNYASAQSTTAPFFSLGDTIEGFACQMFIEGDVRPITHFKVIQTSDYELVGE